MTRKEIKEMLPIMQAFADGKTIEIYGWKNKWKEVDEPSFDIDAKYYRIKPEPKYRPFKSYEECWHEMLKHQPFGWIKINDIKRLRNINSIDNCTIDINNSILHFDTAFNIYKFADGTPFGIKEE